MEHAWQRVLAEWDDERAHRAFLTLASAAGRLAEAGRRYRELAERDPAKAASAQAQIDRITGLALQGLASLKTDPAPQRRKYLVIGIAFAVMSAMVLSAV